MPSGEITRRSFAIGGVVAAAFRPLGASAADGAGTLTVTGDVKRTLSLDVNALRAFAPAAQGSYRTAREIDGRPQAPTEVKGVRLFALLEQAGLAERDRFDWRKTAVIASARDGYRVVFSWPELANTAGGAQVLVVYERDGEPLGDQEGPLAIAVPGDIRSGPRHVKWLQRIEVRVLRE
jgi:DMSO/TMAO reductase YedYZ molybdopterin-dependent catalytic subunit